MTVLFLESSLRIQDFCALHFSYLYDERRVYKGKNNIMFSPVLENTRCGIWLILLWRYMVEW